MEEMQANYNQNKNGYNNLLVNKSIKRRKKMKRENHNFNNNDHNVPQVNKTT